ncbi:hypothetical protein [Massilia eburnea]|uniref:hypothetical protein n=1 Tax=Massilia eburnea TaxID=1776165 RepID=UPI003D6BC7C2
MFHKLIQSKMRCTSFLVDMPVRNYLDMVGHIYKNDQGGIPGQRAALKTKTAKTIRERMVADILKGVSLPPIVIGVLADPKDYPDRVNSFESVEQVLAFVKDAAPGGLSIIDGMQRTTALLEALAIDADAVLSNLRVEFWVTDGANNLVYRMLVLNTGQVPWDVARQLEAVYRPLLKRVEAQGYGLEFLSKDVGRRSNLSAAEYETEDVVELLLIFSSRKRELNLKDHIAQDFVRLDMIESSSHVDFIDYFTRALKMLSRLNSEISKFEAPVDMPLSRYSQGRELFRGFPAKAGFISALAIYLFDAPGFDPIWSKVDEKFNVVEININRIVELLSNAQSMEEKAEILNFEDLEERIAKHKVGTSQVGRFEREYFEKAFMAIFNNVTRISNFRAGWLAY